MTACAADPGPTPDPSPRVAETSSAADSLEGRVWRLATLAGAPVTVVNEVQRPSLQFDAATGRLTGTTGVNRMTGPYARSGATLRIAEIAASRRASTDDAAMERESRYLAMLEAVRGWRLVRGALVLVDAEGRELATFTR